MKKSLVLVGLILLWAAESNAETAPPSSFDPSADLTRLAFYPHLHGFLIEPDYRFSINDSSSSASTESIPSYQEADISIEYGLFDRVWLTLTEQDLFAKNSTLYNQSSGALSSASLTEGFSDPSLTVSARFFEKAYSPIRQALSLDASLGVSPDFIGGKVGTSNVNGNYEIGSNGKGYWSGTLTSTLTWTTGLNDLALELYYQHRFAGKTADLDSNGNAYLYETENTNVVQTILIDRFHLTNDLYLNLELTLYWPYSTTTDNPANAGGANVAHKGLYVTPALTLGWRALPYFVIEGTFQYQDDTEVTDKATGAYGYSRTIDGNAAVRLKFQI